MDDKKTYRLLTVELIIIILAEIVCTRQNWSLIFNTIVIVLLIITIVLFFLWNHKKDKEEQKESEENKEWQD